MSQEAAMARVLVAGFAVTLLLVSCFRSPAPAEVLQGFALQAPPSVAEAAPFVLGVEAIGSSGTQPFTSFTGVVALSISAGTIQPTTITVDDGVGEAPLQITGAQGDVVVSVSFGGVVGTREITVDPLTAVPGSPDAAVNTAIPDFRFVPRPADYAGGHPGLSDLLVSFNTLVVVFGLDVSVAGANDTIASEDAHIVGGVPGVAGAAEGILFLRLPSTTHAEMIEALARLRSDPRVLHAVQDSLLEIPDPRDEAGDAVAAEGAGRFAVPAPNTTPPADWTWERTPAGGNWGLELLRVPQMWNLNGALAKAGRSTFTGVLDGDFAEGHADVVYAVNFGDGTEADRLVDHGMHVAGTIGALHDNGIGIDGINPFARLITYPLQAGSVFGFFDFLDAAPQLQLVNVSLSHNWSKRDPPVNANESLVAQVLVSTQAEVFALQQSIRNLSFRPVPLVLAAAGNDARTFPGFDARWSSPFTYAALTFGTPNVLVIEAVSNTPAATGGATRAIFSNSNGTLSAPGEGITSTTKTAVDDIAAISSPPPYYQTKSGTSMATPHVTGVAGYLLALDPTLTHEQIRAVLLATWVPVSGGASPRIDAYAAALDIDRVQGGDAVLRMLLDIDDGSPDGNQRVEFDTSIDLTEEDIDADGGIGDGRVDMADFRRWRDWLLIVEGNAAGLDGSERHPKHDVNGNRRWTADGDDENLYPRGDFNGDGMLDRTATRFVPGRVNAEATDLQVLQTLFDDPVYAATDLVNLRDSADVDVWPIRLFGNDRVARIESSIRLTGTEQPLWERTLTRAEPRFVYTAPLAAQGYTVRLEAIDAQGAVLVTTEEQFAFDEAGFDHYWNPGQDLEVEADLPSYLAANTAASLVVRAGYRGDDDQVDYQPGMEVRLSATGGTVTPTQGLTDADGAFTASATLATGSSELVVTVAVTDPATALGVSTTVTAVPAPSCEQTVGDPSFRRDTTGDGVIVTATHRKVAVRSNNGIAQAEASDYLAVIPSDPSLAGKDGLLRVEFRYRFESDGDAATSPIARVGFYPRRIFESYFTLEHRTNGERQVVEETVQRDLHIRFANVFGSSITSSPIGIRADTFTSGSHVTLAQAEWMGIKGVLDASGNPVGVVQICSASGTSYE